MKQQLSTLDNYYKLGVDVTNTKYIDFFHLRKEVFWDEVKRLCEEQFIHSYHLFGIEKVVN